MPSSRHPATAATRGASFDDLVGAGARPCAVIHRWSQKLKAGESRGLPVKGQSAGTACSSADSPDQGIGKRAVPFLERDHGGKDFLFAFHNENVSPKRALDRGGDGMVRKTIGAIEHPYGFDHCHNTDETGVLLGQLPFDQLGRLRRLNGIVLREVADKDVGIESDHRRLARCEMPAALAAAASLISSIVTGRCRRGLTIPRNAEAGIFGNRTTLPSGCTKNLTLSPGFNRRWSRMAFGIVAWPLAVIDDSMMPPLHFCKCNTSAKIASNHPRTGTFPVGQMTDLADIQSRHGASRTPNARAAMSAARWANDPVPSFDDLVGAGEERLWHGQAERRGGLEIDDQLERGRLLDRQIGRLGALKNLSRVAPGRLARPSRPDTRGARRRRRDRAELPDRDRNPAQARQLLLPLEPRREVVERDAQSRSDLGEAPDCGPV